MRFQCPYCKGIVSAESADMGTDVNCGYCQKPVKIPAERTAPGAVIGDFVILRELGRGGMGIVYLAHQLSLDRPAALKILSENYAGNAEFVVGFIKEARAAAKLNHPNIVQAYAVGEDEGMFYFAMEHVDGRTMKEVLAEKKCLPVKEACSIIRQIAEALDYAWKEEKLVHRDIKPDNIMLTSSGRAKLADLGLAKVAGDLETDDGEEVMGTPQYISPEQLTGEVLDCRTDIYSLGATFYQFLTGRFPYIGDTAMEITKQHLDGVLIPPHEVNHEIPENVSRIVVKMMEKNPDMRYQSGDALAEDLGQILRGESPVNAVGTPRPESAAPAFPKLKLNGVASAGKSAAVPKLQLKAPEKEEEPKPAAPASAPAPAPVRKVSLSLKAPAPEKKEEPKPVAPAPAPSPAPAKKSSLALKAPEKKEEPKPAAPALASAPAPAKKSSLALKAPEKKEKLKPAAAPEKKEEAKSAPAEEKKDAAASGKPLKLKKKKKSEGSVFGKILKVVLIVLFLLILAGAGGAAYFIYFKKGDYKEILKKANEVAEEIHKEPSENYKALTALLEELKNAEESAILGKCDAYFEKGFVCADEEEKELLKKVLSYYTWLDERRLEEIRLRKLQAIEKEKAEAAIRAAAQAKAKSEEAARAAEAERQAKHQQAVAELQRRQAEEQRRVQQKKMAEQAAELAKEFRPKLPGLEKEFFAAYLDCACDHDFNKFRKRGNTVLSTLSRAPNDARLKAESERLRGKLKTFFDFLMRGSGFANVYWNGHPNLTKGRKIRFESKANLYFVEKVEKGIVHTEGRFGKLDFPMIVRNNQKLEIKESLHAKLVNSIIDRTGIRNGIVPGCCLLGYFGTAVKYLDEEEQSIRSQKKVNQQKLQQNQKLRKEFREQLEFLIRSVKTIKDDAMLQQLKTVCGDTPEYKKIMR